MIRTGRSGVRAAAIAALIAGGAAAAEPGPFDAAARIEAIRAIENAVERNYVLPELRSAIVGRIEAARQARRLDTDDPALFAQRATEALQAVNHDGHLYLIDDRDQYEAARVPTRGGRRGLDAYRRAEALRTHHGLAAAEILPGNIRYLRISGFQWVPHLTAPIYDEAIRFLKGGDAIIVDLRGNGGGHAEATDYLLDAFLPPGTLIFTYHDGASVHRSRTGRHPLAGRLAGKPLSVLVDGRTGSAAEAFAYAVQQRRAGTIVGSTTYGAANNNEMLPIPPRFILSVSYGRPVSPVSGTNWDGVGVKPDIAADGIQTLDIAALNTLEGLAAAPGLTPETLAGYGWVRTGIEARLHPVPVSHDRLQVLAGTYGPIEIDDSETGLRLYRADRPRWPKGAPLIPLAEDGLFAVNAFAFGELRAHLTGSTLELLYGSDKVREIFPRDGADRPVAQPRSSPK